MIRAFSYDTFIARRPDQVFAYMMDLSRARYRGQLPALKREVEAMPPGIG